MTSPSSPPPAPSRGTHTPGPWAFGPDVAHGGASTLAIRAEDGTRVARAYSPSRYGTPQDDERDANARLIASAPALLAFVERVVRDLPMPIESLKDSRSVTANNDGDDLARVLADARALLSTLARGGAS